MVCLWLTRRRRDANFPAFFSSLAFQVYILGPYSRNPIEDLDLGECVSGGAPCAVCCAGSRLLTNITSDRPKTNNPAAVSSLGLDYSRSADGLTQKKTIILIIFGTTTKVLVDSNP